METKRKIYLHNSNTSNIKFSGKVTADGTAENVQIVSEKTFGGE